MALSMAVLMEIFVLLPAILEAGHNLERYPPKWFHYDSVNGKRLKSPRATIMESYYDPSNVENEKVMSPFRQRAGESRKREESAESNIIFPDSSIFQARNNAEALIPICNGKNFCENVPNYPTDLVNHILSSNPSLMNLATEDAVEIISHRIDSGDSELCNFSVGLINPRSAKNINDDWLFIVQSPESNFTQAIRVEICEDEKPCLKVNGFALGFQTKCRQKYIYRQLTALSHESNLIRDLFPIPASCCCHAIEDPTYQSRRVRTIGEKNRA
ncbi:PREDICTED: protein spaetzle-like isoform X2 [Dinoponera quadriceps]|uniref:Protein spaetzle-like isoform X2 n=1 Tax=Dinoponera quadriceps TaxID=609295 RepID=A0A6P3XXW8_DINQU|nr:PREDICTED: protein spaetzle-like isoform X2 [Dinoponera quadriceps]